MLFKTLLAIKKHHTYSMASQSLKDFDRPLMMVSQSTRILLHLFPTRGRVMNDKTIALKAIQVVTNVLCRLSFARMPIFFLKFFNESPLGELVLRTFKS